MDNSLADLIEKVEDLNNRGKYKESYPLCEKIYIQNSDYKEWFRDNYWYRMRKEDGERDKQFLRLMDLFAISSFFVGCQTRCMYINHKLINTSLTDDISQMYRVRNNSSYCFNLMKEKLLFYPDDIDISKVNFEGKVNLILEDCDELETTLNSIVNAFKDLYLLNRNFIVLGNQGSRKRSSYYKNIVYKKDFISRIPYVYIKKNTIFYYRRNYIKTALAVITENPRVKSFYFSPPSVNNGDDLRKTNIDKLCTTDKNKKYCLYDKVFSELTGLYHNDTEKKKNRKISASYIFIYNFQKMI